MIRQCKNYAVFCGAMNGGGGGGFMNEADLTDLTFLRPAFDFPLRWLNIFSFI